MFDPVRRRATRRAAAVLCVAGLLLVVACGQPSRAPKPGDLLILDADAGSAIAGGNHRGVLFLARLGRDGRYETPTIYAEDPRWIEPVDVLLLPGGDALVLEQQWAPPETPDSLGAVFLVRAPEPGPDPAARGSVQLLLNDERMRQPVAMTRGPDGTLWVSDRAADPLGLGRDTGCVFSFPPATKLAAPLPGPPGAIAAAGAELQTPGAVLRCSDGRLLVMDADANPRGLITKDKRPATPGVLYEITTEGLRSLLEPDITVSPIALIERPPNEIYLVDANAGDLPGMEGDGALFRLVEDETGRWLSRRVDSSITGRSRTLVDPVGGDTLPDGRLILADANIDPMNLGSDGTGKGVYATGHGAVLAIDPDDPPSVTALIADKRFVTPIAVRRVR